MAEHVCLGRFQILKNEGLVFLSLSGAPSLPLAIRNPHKMSVLEFLSLYGRPSLPLAARNPPKMEVLEFLSLCGRPSLPPAGRHPQDEGRVFLKPLWPIVVASGGSKS